MARSDSIVLRYVDFSENYDEVTLRRRFCNPTVYSAKSRLHRQQCEVNNERHGVHMHTEGANQEIRKQPSC